MGYIELSCTNDDCKADVGYGKAINNDGSLKECPHCGCTELHETYYSDD